MVGILKGSVFVEHRLLSILKDVLVWDHHLDHHLDHLGVWHNSNLSKEIGAQESLRETHLDSKTF